MTTHKVLLEFKVLFHQEDYNLYLEKIVEIPQKYIIDFVPTFLRFKLDDESVSNIPTLLGRWFSRTNEKYANYIYSLIIANENITKNKYIIINEITNLLILEAGLKSQASELKMSEVDLEVLFFKIYLAYNQKCTENENLASLTTKFLGFPQKEDLSGKDTTFHSE
ncbi:hypothetical protein JW887_03660 [Candidatus Dojkabacteria bacterium]|nr:hypothetical protein [Candidatus Dojkabacteria bacterium]